MVQVQFIIRDTTDPEANPRILEHENICRKALAGAYIFLHSIVPLSSLGYIINPDKSYFPLQGYLYTIKAFA